MCQPFQNHQETHLLTLYFGLKMCHFSFWIPSQGALVECIVLTTVLQLLQTAGLAPFGLSFPDWTPVILSIALYAAWIWRLPLVPWKLWSLLSPLSSMQLVFPCNCCPKWSQHFSHGLVAPELMSLYVSSSFLMHFWLKFFNVMHSDPNFFSPTSFQIFPTSHPTHLRALSVSLEKR